MKKSKFRGKNFEFYPSYVVTRVFEKSLTFMDMHHTEKQFIGLEFSESAEFIQKLKSLVLYIKYLDFVRSFVAIFIVK